MKKILGSLFILCFAFSANAQLLWKISGNGLTQPSYVMGTHHLAALSIKDSIQGLQAALDNTKQVYGELFAPDKGEYGELLGHSIYFYSKDTGKPVKFVPPAYALEDICKRESDV